MGNNIGTPDDDDIAAQYPALVCPCRRFACASFGTCARLRVKHIQLRLPVGMFAEAMLCHAYVKKDPKFEKRQMAKFKTHLELIRRGQYTESGRLT